MPSDSTNLSALIYQNQRVIDSLTDQLQSANKVIPFVGAGFSKPFGYKLWKEFLARLAEDKTYQGEIATLLDENKLEEAAELLSEKLTSHRLNKEIEHEFGPKKLDDFSLHPYHRHLADLTVGPVITTNYDHVLERSFEAIGWSFERPHIGPMKTGITDTIAKGSHNLLKIHGDAVEETHRVLTRKDYEDVYGDLDATTLGQGNEFPRLLATMMSGTPLFFLGCSLEKDRTMQVLGKILAQQGHIGHFALMEFAGDQAWLEEREYFLGTLRIEPIWFPKGRFDLIPEVLEYLAKKTPDFRQKKSPTPRSGI